MDFLVKFQFEVEPTGAPLTVCVSLDGVEISRQLIDQKTIIYVPYDDGPGQHVMRLELVDKQPHHTVINDQAQVIQDSELKFSNFMIDEIELGHEWLSAAQYSHDYNGHGPAVTVDFHGVMGCNGTVDFEFSAPFYLWYLARV